MPTYHYRCTDCGHEFDQVQRFSDDALTICPSCNGTIRRVFHPAGVVFKGSGWYVTDSRPSDTKKAEKPAAKAEGETSGGSDGAKPETKTEKKDPAPAVKSAESKAPAGA